MRQLRSSPPLVLTALGVSALLLAACTTAPAATSTTPVERTISMAAIEPKGGATVDKEPFPTQQLPAGGGYVLKAPDASGR